MILGWQLSLIALMQCAGHHACCTAKMGTDDGELLPKGRMLRIYALYADEYAVLDGDFRVRGVSSLRVVDLSAWPNVPGWFPTTPMYMVSSQSNSFCTD